MRVLFVKLTSMGDLIHALPAMTDAARAIPDISFDWVVEKNFSEVARWHPAVKNIITTSHRVWRRDFRGSIKNGEIPHFLKSIRKEKYDLVIDGQGSLKSAVACLFAKGLRCGFDKDSIREKIAHWAYQKKFFVEKKQHMIERLRHLFSQILDYPYPKTPPDYGISRTVFKDVSFALPERYLVFVHNASWESKLWPEAYWRKLILLASSEGFHILLPWGNNEEKQRALRISLNMAEAHVLPFCTLSEHAAILKGSAGAICSDTGLSHLAAALNVPAVTMYGPTSTKLIGTTGLNQAHFIAPFPCTLCYQYHCNYNNQKMPDSSCMSAIKPAMLWDKFNNVL